MRELIGIEVLANWASMLRADTDGTIVLVDNDKEGPFYEKCSHDTARILPSNGAARLLLDKINARSIVGVVAVVSGLQSPTGFSDNIFQPSSGDIASLLLCSTCCHKTLNEICGSAWIKAGDKQVGSVLHRTIALAWALSKISHTLGMVFSLEKIETLINWESLRFSKEMHQEFVDIAAVDHDELINIAENKSINELLSEFDGVFAVNLLAFATVKFNPRGLRSNVECAPSDLLNMMRLAFELPDLEMDQMYWKIRAWERGNIKFPFLKPWRILDSLNVVLDQRYWESDLKSMLLNDLESKGMTAIKMDLDNFKNVNDSLGHSSGDQAIKLACTTMTSILSEVAEIYRRGGDEMVGLAPGLRGKRATDLAEELRNAIETKFIAWGNENGLEKKPTASIGLVDVSPGCAFDEIVRLMDEAQGRAKHEGKNKVVTLTC